MFKLVRYRYLNDRTLGLLITEAGVFETLEREGPDSRIKNGKRISTGVYQTSDRVRHDYRIDLLNVPGRTGIQLHTGSRPSHSQGCIIVLGSKDLKLNSRDAVSTLSKYQPFKLEVINA